jgi:Tat protein secretion system quality control protein TatD with DNase activity
LVTFTDESELPALLDAHLHMTHQTAAGYPKHFCYFTNSATPDEWQLVAQLASNRILPFIGIHPECGPGPIDDIGWEENLRDLKRHAATLKVGIGECGIDKRYYSTFSKREQTRLCEFQLHIAEKLQIPISLNQVHANDTLFYLIKQVPLSALWIMNGFFGSLDTARQVLD